MNVTQTSGGNVFTEWQHYATLLTTYRDPTAPGSLGGVARFARAQKLPIGRVRKTLERDLSLSKQNYLMWCLLYI